MHREKFIERVLLLLALSSIGSLALITIFIFLEGFPLIVSAGLKNFILSSHWAPTKGHFGILAMIISSVLVTLGAIIGVPLCSDPSRVSLSIDGTEKKSGDYQRPPGNYHSRFAVWSARLNGCG